MKIFVANTDYEWYRWMLEHPDMDEVNFWRPKGTTNFKALREGELFFFKLKKQYHGKIVGFGQFLLFEAMSVADAWSLFETKNGAPTLSAMWRRVAQYADKRRDANNSTFHRSHRIGTIVITNPVFFPEQLWIDAPEDWRDTIVTGKSYQISEFPGNRIYAESMRAAELLNSSLFEDLSSIRSSEDVITAHDSRYGKPVLTRPRLGQGGFRMRIQTVYGKCAVSGEHSMPALEASHIRPYSDGGRHEIPNGILLRSDIHKLYDTGYVTIDPDYTFRVSDQLKEDYNNGKTYYSLQDRRILLPSDEDFWPDRENLDYHRQTVFRG